MDYWHRLGPDFHLPFPKVLKIIKDPKRFFRLRKLMDDYAGKHAACSRILFRSLLTGPTPNIEFINRTKVEKRAFLIKAERLREKYIKDFC